MGILNQIASFKAHVKWLLLGIIGLAIILPIYFKPHKDTLSSKIPQVSVMEIKSADTPVKLEFVGQTKSSHQVEIRARVSGFLDKRLYTEGKLVKAQEVLFQMDRKPFEAQLDAQKGAFAEQEARLQTAKANLVRVQPLVEQNALSKKDLDDAIGLEQAARAGVETARANVEQAKLNLGYTTIASPIKGLSSYARVQEGTYINPQDSLLTYVYQMDPIWVNFSVSENDVLTYRGESKRGLFQAPKDNAYEVSILLSDGTLYPEKGKITFSDAEYNEQTGTFLVRATVANPKALLRPGQFLRVILSGGNRLDAILVPQEAVFEGAKGNFVWVVDKENKAQIKNVEVGRIQGNKWFINSGLESGDLLIVDGMMKLNTGTLVTITKR